MFSIERSVLPPRSCPRTEDRSAAESGAVPGTTARTPPVPATFLERAAGGAFELFPRRQFSGAGDVVRAALPAPLMAGLLSGPVGTDRSFRATAPLPPVPALSLPTPARLRRRA